MWDIKHTLPEETFYPDEQNVYRAFQELPLEQVRVVILGQDPYHDGSATGLAFDNPIKKRPSPSLMNILQEMMVDAGEDNLNSGGKDSWLEHLPKQGVLLLNTALTVRPKEPGSHLEHWKPFTKRVIEQINTLDYVVWILWGEHAKSYKELINPSHGIVESGHPSPLARGAKVPFKGSKPFSRTNNLLVERGKGTIQW